MSTEDTRIVEVQPASPARPRLGRRAAAAGRGGRHGGYADPTLMAGRPVAISLYLVALALAVGADFGNFYQIIQFAMPTQTDWVLFIVVLGFTACVVYLAHLAGVILRSRKAGETWIPASAAWLCLAAWLGLGLCGLYLRLTWQDPDTGPAPVTVIGQAAPNGTPVAAPSAAPNAATSALPSAAPTATASTGDGNTQSFPVVGSALVFLGLYVGTGLLASVGGFLTHNPARGDYVRAKRAYEDVVEPAADSAKAYAEASGALIVQLTRRANADKIALAESLERLGYAEELKQLTRAMIAQVAQDAALTDAYFPEEKWGRPGDPTQPGASR